VGAGTTGRGLALAFAAGWVLGACSTPRAFACAGDAQCIHDGVSGSCVDGSCAFPSEDCASELAWGEHAGALSGQCVPPPGTGTDGGRDTTSGGPGPGDDDPPDPDGAATTGSPTSGVGPGTTTAASTDDDAEEGATTTDASTDDPVDPDLVLWLRFDPDAGLFEDATANGFDAACDPGQCPVAAPGGGVTFDGIDDALVVPHDPLLDLPELTITVRASVADFTAGPYATVVGKPVETGTWNSWEIALSHQDGDTNADFYFGMWDGAAFHNAYSPAVYTEDQWYRLTATYDGATLRLYVDGSLIADNTSPMAYYDDHPIYIGADLDDGVVDNHLPATLDDLRIWSRPLTEPEIVALP
jgi:hypothetical protein